MPCFVPPRVGVEIAWVASILGGVGQAPAEPVNGASLYLVFPLARPWKQESVSEWLELPTLQLPTFPVTKVAICSALTRRHF